MAPLLVTAFYVLAMVLSLVLGERLLPGFLRARRPSKRPGRKILILWGAVWSVVSFLGALGGSLIGHQQGYDPLISSLVGSIVIFTVISFLSALVRGFIGVRKNASR